MNEPTRQEFEDEGLAKGTTYTIKLVTANNATVATATLTMK